MTNSLFESAQARMSRQAQERVQIKARIQTRVQTDDSSRLNAYLHSKGYTQEQINDLIQAHETITNAKLQLGIKS